MIKESRYTAEQKDFDKFNSGMSREELDKICVCGHKREHHTIRDKYCYQFDDNNNPCDCRCFIEVKKEIKNNG